MPYLTSTPYAFSIPVTVRITADKSLMQHNVIYTTPAGGAPKNLQDLVNTNLTKENADTSAQLHLQQLNHPIVPLFTVDFYSRGQRYHLASSCGIIQWYIEQQGNRTDNGTSVRSHEFLSCKVQSVKWCVWNLLIYLQRAHLCLPLQASGTEKGKWWVISIGLSWGKKPDDPETKFVSLWVREDVKLAQVFEVLAGHEIEGWFSLSQWAWGAQEGRPRCWYYDDALECGVILKDCGWMGDHEGTIWLRTQVV